MNTGCDFLASGHPKLFFPALASNKQIGKVSFSSFKDEISVEGLKHSHQLILIIAPPYCKHAQTSESRW